MNALAPHPSRNAIKCKDCAHVVAGHHQAFCNHPSMPVSLVTGDPVVPVHVAREGSARRTIRDLGTVAVLACGPEGGLFQLNASPSGPQA